MEESCFQDIDKARVQLNILHAMSPILRDFQVPPICDTDPKLYAHDYFLFANLSRDNFTKTPLELEWINIANETFKTWHECTNPTACLEQLEQPDLPFAPGMRFDFDIPNKPLPSYTDLVQLACCPAALHDSCKGGSNNSPIETVGINWEAQVSTIPVHYFELPELAEYRPLISIVAPLAAPSLSSSLLKDTRSVESELCLQEMHGVICMTLFPGALLTQPQLIF